MACRWQTDIGSDALSPPSSATLPQVLRRASKELMVHALPRGTTFWLSVEAPIRPTSSTADRGHFDAVSQFALSRRDEVLAVGASGLVPR